ncbi:hypothetical protein J5Y04_26435 [Kitasatospora sp. RG8]|uniref:hypothetical protein n=1 Tax=Kitasatospora sp. RG8 TaxID=2820815 RepID=UPI001ADF7BEF|nr:hypothetical protein [Kitasatospora sp. RG8]MBP0453055.1 hypothetical protein [Kitasatospora sp. RG8]
MHGSHTESVGAWWGSGWYETMARRAIARAADAGTLRGAATEAFSDADRLADAAAHHPDLLEDTVFARVTEALHEEQSLLRHTRTPVPTATTLPDWAAQHLTAVLQADPDEHDDLAEPTYP